MTYEVVHKEPIYRLYKASTVSSAHAVRVACDFVRIFLPLIIIFATHGLWKKTGTYRERPRVNFDGRYLLLLMSGEQYVFSSTLPVLNAAENSHFVVSQLDHQWISHTDEQDTEIAITVPTHNLTFNTLIYFVFFNYTLDYHSSVEAEAALCDTVHLSSSTAALDILGRVAADQRMPFRWRERYELFDEDRLDVEYYTPIQIMERIIRQPFNIRLDRKLQLETTSEGSIDQFQFKLKAVIAEDEFVYKTDFWELLKWGAVQYVFAFITVNYFTNSFLNCLFRNQVIEVVPCCEALQGNLK
ncbi:hypothetical protein Q1695_006124 [Nippostrongylus brasiliensis]|nr:hypothetical protein Q1695_006124 [Nippostrongylus brasiliensis]